MIHIDLDADLNMEDDEGRNLTTVVPGAKRPTVGRPVIAGRPNFWSWVIVDAVDENDNGTAVVTFHQVSAKHAASVGPLVAAGSNAD